MKTYWSVEDNLDPMATIPEAIDEGQTADEIVASYIAAGKQMGEPLTSEQIDSLRRYCERLQAARAAIAKAEGR